MRDPIPIHYQPAGPTLLAFHQSEAFVRGIMGPVGSGKSTACVMEILRRAARQQPGPDGRRQSRWAIIRNSYPELKSTTLKTWEQWAPLDIGCFTRDAPITHRITTEELDVEVLFLALDRDEDQRKLLSLELTGAWINEAREIPKCILDTLTGRVGRYPPQTKQGATWSGIIMDTNPPETESWWYRLAELEQPHDWEFFRQPPGDGETAENLLNLPCGYYSRVVAGKDEDWIHVYVRGDYGFVMQGKPVFPMFRDHIHTAKSPLTAEPHLPLVIGVDFGLTPAAVIGQRMVSGQWRILEEVIAEDVGTSHFAELLGTRLARHFSGHVAEVWGDPAGNQRAQTDGRTALEILREYSGLPAYPAPTNDVTMRRETVVAALSRLIDGEPGFLLSPSCHQVRKGFAGGYHYQRIRTGEGHRFCERPAKNEYSHPHDALQYLLLGGGEHHVMMRRRSRDTARPVMARMDWDVFADCP